MKIDRLIGILSLLLQKDTVTAPYLAEHFEVSRRTINRDIEDLCRAGVPVVTRQGIGGGISIMDNYKISKTLLTNAEMQDILAGLRSLDSVNGTDQYKQLMEKLSAGSSDLLVGNQAVLIDLSSWYKDSLAPKIQIIRNAIENCRKISFYYYSPGGESVRSIEPYYLIFHWSSWYVWGWCDKRQDYRLFKLNRLEQLTITGDLFVKRKVILPDFSDERIFPGGIHVRALFWPECKWRLVEEFGTGCYEEQADGKLLFHADYTDQENLISWILTFGDRVELLEPKDIREIICGIAENMVKNYKRPEGNA
ncbi:MAG: YafY family transcriptional regulator [Eubacterium sp.]|nr:YafY family transcriptional regulator [Eubacterium sp.]MCM1304432.1 YafY family transcriptional regulator [Butyrivibrio sp.]MCM1343885.1 YafY family transcriptional regulator [Muribaculaceae bacterium]MCM1408953.1 YafY family transcriptional regulator [Lachnospiraceae bacterium]